MKEKKKINLYANFVLCFTINYMECSVDEQSERQNTKEQERMLVLSLWITNKCKKLSPLWKIYNFCRMLLVFVIQQLYPVFEVQRSKCFLKLSLANLLVNERLHINCLFSKPFIKCVTGRLKSICIFALHAFLYTFNLIYSL